MLAEKTAILMEGKSLAKRKKDEIKVYLEKIEKEYNIKPCVASILVGDDQAAKVYINSQLKACKEVGIDGRTYFLANETTQEDLLDLIEELNNDDNIDGIMLNLPLPKHIDSTIILNRIKIYKDVDGFKAENLGLLVQNNKNYIAPSTPAGIMEILKEYKIDIEGKEVVVVGRSNIVGKPMAALILNKHGTVTICNSYTKNLEEKTKRADILISAVGKVKFITEAMVKDGSVVVDIGINRVDGKLVGDVDFENVKNKVSYITPVPGGVGATTVAMLMSNIVNSFKINRKINI